MKFRILLFLFFLFSILLSATGCDLITVLTDPESTLSAEENKDESGADSGNNSTSTDDNTEPVEVNPRMEGYTYYDRESLSDTDKVIYDNNFCRGNSKNVLKEEDIIRSSWMFYRGKEWQDFEGMYGYPCGGFKYVSLPPLDDPDWTLVANPEDLDFYESSTFCDSGIAAHYAGEFTYFRINIWIPSDVPFNTVDVKLDGIDDSAKLWIFNSDYPNGYTQLNDQTCHGNGSFVVDFSPWIVKGEMNTVIIAHMDSNCSKSALKFADLYIDDNSPIVYDCREEGQ